MLNGGHCIRVIKKPDAYLIDLERCNHAYVDPPALPPSVSQHAKIKRTPRHQNGPGGRSIELFYPASLTLAQL